MKIKDLPKSQRPREKLISQGPDNLKNEELLAIILGTGAKGKDVLTLAKQVIIKYPIKHFSNIKYSDLIKIKGINSAKASTIIASIELVKRALKIQDSGLPIVQTINDVVLQVGYIKDKTREHFVAIYLNARNELLFRKHIFIGTLNASLVHPREIFQEALKQNAASIILVHNHPSGDPEPSEDDLIITKRIVEAGKIMGIDILDHIIITKNKVFSFKEKKLI